MKRWTILAVAVCIVAATGAACGGGGGGDKNEGAATAAVAAYFVEERDGARIPEGTGVQGFGVQASDIHRLNVRGEDSSRSVKDRYCMEYHYQDPANGFKDHRRVYIAELIDGAWSVNAVKPDGTCDGVE